MPSFADSAVIMILALMLFGPKKLPQLARQLGKLMAEFRRASNEFRMQMEDELRIEEQKEHQKKVDAMAGPPSVMTPLEPAAAVTTEVEADAPIAESGELKMMPPSTGLPVESAAWGTTSELEAMSEDGTLPAAETTSVGISSEEPVSEASTDAHEQAHA